LEALREREAETHRGLDPSLDWSNVNLGPVDATQPPPGWDGSLCPGCRWPDLCAVLGPQPPHAIGGPCASWPMSEAP
jgi:hypothetical protein